MPVSLSHQFVSTLPNSADSTLISSSEWNDTHMITATGVGVAGNFSGGVGPVSIIAFAGNLTIVGGELTLAGEPEFDSVDLTVPLSISSGGSGENTAVDTLTALDLDLTGSITFSLVNVTPAGYLKANGAAVSRATYARLFARVGTQYGAGDGATTFNLPDLRGEFLRGWDDSRGVDSGRAVASFQSGQMTSHFHPFSGNVGGNGFHAHTMFDALVRDSTGGVGANARYVNASIGNNQTGARSTDAGGSHAHSFSGTTGAAGAENRPSNMPLVAFIKF